MERGFQRISPLIEQLCEFCRGHEESDHGTAAAEMLAYVAASWPDAPTVELPAEGDEPADPDALALALIRDIGELAGMLLEEGDAERAFSWGRSNLAADLERYARAVGA